ncbi:hypothetical protein ACQ4PT_034944 [Festuca glaucescens]
MEGGGGGKMGYGGHHHHHDTAKLLKAVSRTVEPRNFGIGLVAGFLIVTCAYFSTAKFDAIHIALVSPDARNAAAGIGTPVSAAKASNQRLDDLAAPDLEDALSKLGSKAEVLDKDDDGKILPSPETDSGQTASLGNTRKDDTFASGGGGGALLPPLSSEEPANSTQEQGGLEDEELQVQDAIANSPKKSNNGSSPAVFHSDPATLPVPPVQQIPPAQQQETKAPPVQQIPLIPEAKKTGTNSSSTNSLGFNGKKSQFCFPFQSPSLGFLHQCTSSLVE